ncbi:hypothetical protein [Amnibacterium kyonggiense]|uniref:hypothetical protein n=1 Tax=Amnibacterium kyonggiense TaxID=595671 RepID=UPI001060BDED|nr:hypothetical protein [Amnibacterium kyonggiense]
MSTQHIGAAGELLVQYRLLKLEIDSARLTTDSGVDLVVYAPGNGTATTVQVKTVREPTPAGGRGAPAIGWTFPHASPAQMLAVVLLSTDMVWLFTMDEARLLAQQHSEKGARRLYWYVGAEKPAGVRVGLHQAEVERYRLERRAPHLFPAGPGPVENIGA